MLTSRSAFKLNPLWKTLARILSASCRTCGNPHLFSIFDAYLSGSPPRCAGCASLYYVTLPLVRRVFGRAGLTEEGVQLLLQDTLIRRSMLNVVRGIGHFGLRVPQPTAVPVVVVWNVTNRCNLACIHCHQDSGEPERRELTTEEAFTLIDHLGRAGVSILTFSGGEPLVRPDLFDVIKRADEAGMMCTIASNGTLITADVAHTLKTVGVKRVEIGLDGACASTHDFLRNQPGSFDLTVRGMKACVEEGFDEVCATMTLHTRNVGELGETVKLAEELGATRFYVNRLIPAGRGKNVHHLDTTKEERATALETMYDIFYKNSVKGDGIQCYARGMTYYGRLGYEKSCGTVFTVSEALSGYSRMWEKVGGGIADLIQKYAAGFGGCSAGITYAGLTASGILLPCVPASIHLGNLLEEDLEDLWVHSEELNYLRRRDELKGNCGKCGYNTVCGGCRYTAYALQGDWLEADPSCPFGPAQQC